MIPVPDVHVVCKNQPLQGDPPPHGPVHALGLCVSCYSQSVLITGANGKMQVAYTPQMHQMPFHASNAPNLLALGTRGTGKSKQLRWDAIVRCLAFPGFHALILRRTKPDLRKSHLHFIEAEMKALGGVFLWTTFEAKFPNGSLIQFSHCEKMADVLNYLSSEWDYIGFDELSTFTLDMFLQIGAAARSPEDKPYRALVRASSNPLGPGAQWMKVWFVDKSVDLGAYPDYHPDDFEMQFSSLEQNRYISTVEYANRLKNLPEHVRRAWLYGEFVIEGAYFSDFRKRDDAGNPWHVIQSLPKWRNAHGEWQDLRDLSWVGVYRAVDWGYFPDPWVCLWIFVLPNKQTFVFKERHNTRMLAADVAKQIKRESVGLHIIETFCDPTMFIKDGTAPFSIGEIFEQNGIPLTAAQNDRELYGYSIHEYLNTMIDGFPQGRIVESACPNLVRTMPMMQMDPKDTRKLADGEDHWVVAWAYFCMGRAMPVQEPHTSTLKRWMMPLPKPKMRYA